MVSSESCAALHGIYVGSRSSSVPHVTIRSITLSRCCLNLPIMGIGRAALLNVGGKAVGPVGYGLMGERRKHECEEAKLTLQ